LTRIPIGICFDCPSLRTNDLSLIDDCAHIHQCCKQAFKNEQQLPFLFQIEKSNSCSPPRIDECIVDVSIIESFLSQLSVLKRLDKFFKYRTTSNKFSQLKRIRSKRKRLRHTWNDPISGLGISYTELIPVIHDEIDMLLRRTFEHETHLPFELCFRLYIYEPENVLKSITEYVKNVKDDIVPFGDTFPSIAKLKQMCYKCIPNRLDIRTRIVTWIEHLLDDYNIPYQLEIQENDRPFLSAPAFGFSLISIVGTFKEEYNQLIMRKAVMRTVYNHNYDRMNLMIVLFNENICIYQIFPDEECPRVQFVTYLAARKRSDMCYMYCRIATFLDTRVETSLMTRLEDTFEKENENTKTQNNSKKQVQSRNFREHNLHERTRKILSYISNYKIHSK